MAQAEYGNNAIRALITGAGAKLPISPIETAYAVSVATLTRHPGRHIFSSADAIKLAARANYVNKALSTVSVDAAATLNHVAQDVLGGLHLCHFNGLRYDSSLEMGDILRQAVERVARRVA